MTDAKQHREYSQKGGMRIGRSFWISINWSYPLATIRVDGNAITLQSSFLFLRRKYIFERAYITKISAYNGLLSSGLRIQHTTPSFPPFIIFWTSSWEELGKHLTELGYPYDDVENRK